MEKYALWKEKIKIFIEKINYDIWKTVKDGLFVSTHQVKGVIEIKDR